MKHSGLRSLLKRWLINTAAVLVAANVIRGISYDSIAGLVVASLILGILNSAVRPVLLFFSLPLLLATFGLFMLVINAFMLYLVGWIVKPFHVDGFWAAFWGALVISLVSLIAAWLSGSGESASSPHSRRDQTPRSDSGGGDGPIIDV